ncbi:MarR family winged helix-turn-helix transcriptional regulator [Halarcobacter sp.]|uniref:MarR family winged helix-turn-helix transcriptional regulator n=1 Tax=Halarcobacter TaxID=2321115 RepID=UPI003A903F7B
MNYALKDSIAYRLIRSSNSVVNSLNKILSAYDIAIEQRATLEIIKYEPNVNQTKIAQLLGKDKTTISRSLNSLEKKELITRESDTQNDKRSNKIKLTKKGERILEETLPYVNDFREGLNSKISEKEHKLFFEILDKLEL